MNYSGGTTGGGGGGGGGQGHGGTKSVGTQLSELANSASQRNWRGIGIALLVIIAVCSLIFTAVVLLTPSDGGPRFKGERFNLDDIVGINFIPADLQLTWISTTELLYKSSDGSLVLYDVENGNQTALLSTELFRRLDVEYWKLSPDRMYLLLACGVQKVRKHSFTASYLIYDIYNNTEKPLTHAPLDVNHFRYRLAIWGSVGNAIFFVYKNNLYYKDSVNGNVKQLTTSNEDDDAILNGVPDWLYEMEILKTTEALWLSADGKYVCFATFNDTLVSDQYYEMYLDKEDPNQSHIYPLRKHIKYPKVGKTNPTVTLRVIDLSVRSKSFASVDVKPPLAIKDQLVIMWDHYITAVGWASNTNLSVIWMNRRQNLSIVSICSPPLWICNESFREDMKQLGWVDWYEPPIFNSDGKKYLIRAAINDGNAGLFRQIVLNHVDDRSSRTITMGKFEVTKILSYDDRNNLIYFIAAPENRPGERHLYKISTTANMVNASGYCLTCQLGHDCLYNDVTISPMAQYYVLQCKGPLVPSVHIYNTSTNKRLKTLDTNDAIQRLISQRARPYEKTFRVPIDDNYDANVRLYLPPEFQEEETIQYPLVIYVDGSPGSQTVDQKFRVDFGTFITSNKSFIYGMIDGRGSGFQGEKRKFELYKRFGTVEVEDQINVITYLLQHLSFVDKRKVAIWGWSYGGYVTSRVMAAGDNAIKCGIAVAPITSWKFYS
ncbi:Inactive dipeptidyl peptidase 10 [Chamberlinius hualienensis]